MVWPIMGKKAPGREFFDVRLGSKPSQTHQPFVSIRCLGFAGSIRIFCHKPGGWLERSVRTDPKATVQQFVYCTSAIQFKSMTSRYCHRDWEAVRRSSAPAA